jgi:TPR repeat protein
MFEVANCFLDGVGVKKDSEVAVSYLRLAGDLGDLHSQEREWD